ncbi:MAG: META domain-containing protein [Bacteroidales bacterium]|nr:META domain-containing protein [Bacteroidales bacterium]
MLENQWQFVAVEDLKTGNLLTVSEGGNEIFISFSNNKRITIGSNCNFGDARYQTDGQLLSVSDLNFTEMICDDKSVDTWEKVIIGNLIRAEQYEIKRDQLTIKTSGIYNLKFSLKPSE